MKPGILATIFCETFLFMFHVAMLPVRFVRWFVDTFYDPRNCP